MIWLFGSCRGTRYVVIDRTKEITVRTVCVGYFVVKRLFAPGSFDSADLSESFSKQKRPQAKSRVASVPIPCHNLLPFLADRASPACCRKRYV